MIDPSEVQLDKTPPPTSGAFPRRSATPWFLAAGVLLIGGAAAWFFLSGRQGEQTTTPQLADPASSAQLLPAHGSAALCRSTEAIALPSLDEIDGLAGALATTLSAHPRVTAWLATDDVVRRFAVVVEMVASGKSPAVYLGPLRPSGGFRTTERGDELFADPRNYARFAPIAAAVESVDVEAAARVCSGLKPRLDEAYLELGRGGTFDSALERAIVSLLETPVMAADTRLVPQGASYGFEDPALEGLTPAQKHLARMGPEHARAIKDKLRQIALAIGIPPDRLPQ